MKCALLAKKSVKNPFFRISQLLVLVFSAVLLISSCQSKAKKRSKDTEQAKKQDSVMTLGVKKVLGDMKPLTDMAFLDNGDVWVTEQTGKIWVLKNGKREKEPLLDVGSKMVKLSDGYEERGLLDVALHPDFATNKKFYVFYSRPSKKKDFNNTGVVAAYQLSESGTVDPDSGRIILTVDEPQGNHNGGCLKFGPDGYLYVTLGDGGGQHDQHGTIGNGQNLNTLLGKILRININTENGYNVPKDNPFVDQKDARPEIWAYGFRNPYRISFDQKTGRLFAGEVGQDLWEEVDIVKKGANYGWRIMEGAHCHNIKNKPDDSCDKDGLTMPIAEYNHKEGVSVTGGHVYRGKDIPELDGDYVFADWTGPVFYLEESSNDTWRRKKIILKNIPENLKITSINEDRNGELYFLTNPDTGPGNEKCAIYKIVKP